ncbi:MAG: LysM peptidoglycan-binding domain-containing M23 family metallopeptidase [Alkalinema sp. CAN_BIN05]|nr:LysM peptidoglycan-binding domain-containing M23 family metallopeptidase [Alkalinema sp. CAN_BIN05]
MESTIPQKSISTDMCGSEASSDGGLGKKMTHASHRSYGSTAMLSVAIIGTCGLFSPHAGDAAIAVEMNSTDALSTEAPGVAQELVPTLAYSNLTESAQSVVLPSHHTVQEGENLSQIAKIHGVSLQGVALLNRLDANSVLRVGQVISLDMVKTKLVPSRLAEIPQDSAASKVKQNISAISKRSAELDSQSFKLASVPSIQAQSSEFVTHQVSPGENLSTIARIHGMSPSALASLNQITNENVLKTNQVLKVPSQKVAPVSTEVFQTIATLTPSLNVELDAEAPAPPLPGQAIESRRYVDGLIADVTKIRQKYQPTAVAYRPYARSIQSLNTLPTPSLPKILPSRPIVNPDMRSTSTSRGLTPVAFQSVPEIKASMAPRVLARASVGTDAYAPVVQPSARQMVSPEMPTIGAADSYLPRGKGGGAMNGFIWPSKGVMTSGYGQRWGRPHRGIDIAAPIGTPIVASAPGVISYAGYNDGGFGYLVEVDHADGTMTRYAHNDRILVSVGQQVNQGEQISLMGSTGNSTGPHLHFEIHPGGQGAVNPMAYLPNNRG